VLEFSPDWDSRYCYLAVLICAFLSARVQLGGRLAILQQKAIYAWGLLSTWIVFSVYLIFPLALFWLLDRTGALSDTSVFAALLVGLAYPAILSGGTNIKTTEGLAGVFAWLNKSMDDVITRTTSMVALKSQLFQRAVVDQLEKDGNALAKVRELALQYADMRAQAKADIEAKKDDPRGQAELVYDLATGSALGLKPITDALPELGIRARSPYAEAKRWRIRYFCGVTALCAACIVYMFSPGGRLQFVTWRLTKAGISEMDLHRTREALTRLLGTNDAVADKVRPRLIAALQQPGLESKRADEILQLLIAHRGDRKTAGFVKLAMSITDAVRVDSVDVRARVNHALVLLADEANAGKKADEKLDELRKWEPLAKESLIDLEQKWRAWHEWWDSQNKGIPGQSEPAAAHPPANPAS
jgi:hypothetical protein